MILPGIRKEDFTCDGCGARLDFAQLPLFISHKLLAVECPLCHCRMQIRINSNGEVELLNSNYEYQDYYQDEKGLTYTKDEEGNFLPTPLDRGN